MSSTMTNSNADAPTALATLRATFGHAKFRDGQAAIVEHVIAGGDALVLMPTGSGMRSTTLVALVAAWAVAYRKVFDRSA